jgi:hypothetical protein
MCNAIKIQLSNNKTSARTPPDVYGNNYPSGAIPATQLLPPLPKRNHETPNKFKYTKKSPHRPKLSVLRASATSSLKILFRITLL